MGTLRTWFGEQQPGCGAGKGGCGLLEGEIGRRGEELSRRVWGERPEGFGGEGWGADPCGALRFSGSFRGEEARPGESREKRRTDVRRLSARCWGIFRLLLRRSARDGRDGASRALRRRSRTSAAARGRCDARRAPAHAPGGERGAGSGGGGAAEVGARLWGGEGGARSGAGGGGWNGVGVGRGPRGRAAPGAVRSVRSCSGKAGPALPHVGRGSGGVWGGGRASGKFESAAPRAFLDWERSPRSISRCGHGVVGGKKPRGPPAPSAARVMWAVWLMGTGCGAPGGSFRLPSHAVGPGGMLCAGGKALKVPKLGAQPGSAAFRGAKSAGGSFLHECNGIKREKVTCVFSKREDRSVSES